MREKIVDIGLKIILSWIFTVGCVAVDLSLLFFLIGIFQDIIIVGILLSIPIITFIIIFSITCFHYFIDTWKKQ